VLCSVVQFGSVLKVLYSELVFRCSPFVGLVLFIFSIDERGQSFCLCFEKKNRDHIQINGCVKCNIHGCKIYH
jgi:hypothetical protein